MKALLVLFTLFAVLFASFDENKKIDDWDYNATIPMMDYKKAGMAMPSTVWVYTCACSPFIAT